MPIYDLSTMIEPTREIRIDYQDHKKGAEGIKAMFGLDSSLLRDNEGWAVEEIVRLGTHSSTHIDAPWHYNSMIQGKKAQTIDELPLNWFFNDGVVLEMRHKKDGEAVTEDEVKDELDRIGYTLKDLDIVLVRNGQDKFYGRPDYMSRGCGVTAQATRWLYDQGVRVMGIDAWGWDRPLKSQADEAMRKNQSGIFWEAHQADIPYCQIERLVNLDPLPAFGFKVCCFPLKIKNGSAAPARVVAIM